MMVDAATMDSTSPKAIPSVEVIATVADDGSIRTRSIPVSESSKLHSSLVDENDTDAPQKTRRSNSTNTKQQKDSSTSLLEQPNLVPVGSHSDSEDSDDDEANVVVLVNSPSQSSNTALVLKTSTTTTDAALQQPQHSQNASVATNDDGNMYDCLSDQFTRLFCPIDQPNYCIQQKNSQSKQSQQQQQSSQSSNQTASTSCEVVACSDYYQFKEATDVFSSLQFWLTPSQEETLKVESQCSHPQNRSTAPRRRKVQRSHHLSTLWNSWHGQKTIPLERSKSMPDDFGAAPSVFNQYLADEYYDSDPEQEHSKRSDRGESLRKPPRRDSSFREYSPRPIQISIRTIYEDEECVCFENESDDHLEEQEELSPMVPPTPRNSQTTHGRFDFYPRRQDSFTASTEHSLPPRHNVYEAPVAGPSESEMMHPEGDKVLRDFIQEATNTRIPIVWHRRTMACDAKLKPPVAVTGAFEVGAHLDQLVVQPKFTWSPAYEPHLESRKIRLSGTEPDSIELLSIIRVIKPTHLNRALYPFARLDRTVCITTNDEEFPYLVMEASSPQERNWLVKALKMIVARLASIIIVRDEAMLLEFFTPYAALMHLEEEEQEERQQRMLEHEEQQQYQHQRRYYRQRDEDEDSYGQEPVPYCEEQRQDRPALDSSGELQLVTY